MKVAIISGITGQDGSLLAALLLGKKYRVVGLVPHDRPSDHFRLDYLDIKSKVVLISIDLLNEQNIRNLLEEVRPDEFYNLAAVSSVGLSFKQPLLTYNFNTRSVINILESIRHVSSKTRFYQASSSEMFGNVGQASLPIKESLLFHPVSPYGISKASAHWLTVNYREAYKLKTCCGILFNHESALRPSQFVIKKIVRTALDIKVGVQKKLVLGNTAIARDWGYAPFYVEAMWKMMQKDELEDYLICSGTPAYLSDFAFEVFAQLGMDSGEYISIDQSLMRSLDLEIIYGDNTKARESLNWNYEMDTAELIRRLILDERDLMKWEAGLKSST